MKYQFLTLTTFRKGISPIADDRVEIFYNSLIGLWESRTNRLWEWVSGRVEVVRPRNNSIYTLFPKIQPIDSITLVRQSTSLNPKVSSDWVELADTEYYLEDKRALKKINSPFNPTVEITYNAGYTEDGSNGVKTPRDIIQAILTQAEFMLKRNDSNKIATHSLAFEKGSSEFLRPDFHPLFKAVSAKYSKKMGVVA